MGDVWTSHDIDLQEKHSEEDKPQPSAPELASPVQQGLEPAVVQDVGERKALAVQESGEEGQGKGKEGDEVGENSKEGVSEDGEDKGTGGEGEKGNGGEEEKKGQEQGNLKGESDGEAVGEGEERPGQSGSKTEVDVVTTVI